ncbi:GlxA family transcriptional regulator [Hymenobacter cellulosilyticus]|uniref:Helix-turn-helix domain-containing protein n=1 Tax=Hymenobacter cellulosilyticus TaxID=2932248 RepID=A0A8T9PYK1_9BACT|nr:helix-turn-helix domain-containing protein [Hymenobacter cellulosilyticus]UOQ70147.1 helix-turn-helix domain-containing protein [Hymenobacter cellulosilyticus]
MMTRIFFCFPAQVHLLDINGPAHIFYEARELGADLELHFLSLDGAPQATSSAGLAFTRLESFGNFTLGPQDYVFLPGLDRQLLFDAAFNQSLAPFHAWLRVQHGRGAQLCAVCTGAYLLAGAGLLNGRQCTTHWKYLADFRHRFPAALLLQDRLFVKDQNVYSTAGVSSGIDLALYILEEAYGPLLTAQVAKEVVVYMRRTEKDPQLSVFLQHRNHLDDRIHRVQDHLARDLSQGRNLEKLAAAVSMSPRNLTRLFKKTTGLTIGHYQDKLRLERAVALLREGLKVEAVAQSCGFAGANQFRELLKKQAGVLPSQVGSGG